MKKIDSSHDMMAWQLKTLLGEIQQIELHETGDCPCILNTLEPAERCIGKHLLNISTLSQETGQMSSANKKWMLELAQEANERHEQFMGFICHKEDLPPLAEWARNWRKKHIEPAYYTCKVELHDDVEVEIDFGGDPGQLHDVATADKETKAIRSIATELPQACPEHAGEKSFQGISKELQKRAATIDEIVRGLKIPAMTAPSCPAPAPPTQRATAVLPATCPTNKTFAMGITTTTRYEFVWKLVEGKDLIVSHDPFTFEVNPKFVKALQPRLRDRAATQLQVMNIASKLQPELLLEDFLSLEKGAPIVTEYESDGR